MDHLYPAGASFAAMAEAADDEEAALVELQLKQFDGTRWSGYSEPHPGAQLLDILQESTTILRKHSSTLLPLALLLTVPVSIFLLSHILLRLPLLDQMVISLQLKAQAQFGRQLHAASSRRLAETVMSSVMDVPFSALFSPLLKASVGSVVASTYARKKLKFSESSILKALRKHALAIVQTFLWTCAVYFAFATAFTALLGFVNGSEIDTVSLVVVSVVGVALAAGMAVANVTCNLAYVVSVLEEVHGRRALMESVRLLNGKLEVALLLFLVTNVNGTLLDVLFEFHVLRNGNAEVVYDKYWEAPLLVGMHAFVHLFDAIMVSVLYFMCKAPAVPDSRLGGEMHLTDANESHNELMTEVRSPSSRGSLFGVR